MKRKQFISAVTGVSLSVALGFTALMAPAFAADRDDQVKKRSESQAKIDQANSQLEGVNKDLAKEILSLNQAKSDQEGAQKEYDQAVEKLGVAKRDQAQARDQLEVASAKLDKVEADLDKNQKTQNKIKEEVGQVVRQNYTVPHSNGALDLLTSKKTVAEISSYTRNLALASQIQEKKLSEVENKLVLGRNAQAEQKELTQKVRDLKEEADRTLLAADQAATDKENNLQKLNDSVAKHDRLKADLDSKKSLFEADLAEAQKDYDAAQAQIKKIDEANRKAAEAKQQVANSAGNAGLGKSGGGDNSAGFRAGSIFQAPIKGPIHVNSPFGYRIHPVVGTRLLHSGTDIASGCGNPQYASADGNVFFTANEGTGGNTLKINHGVIGGISWITVYRHMTRFAVSPGTHVSKGQLIGYTGATGRVTGCHVHFEIWKNGTPVDPMPYL